METPQLRRRSQRSPALERDGLRRSAGRGRLVGDSGTSGWNPNQAKYATATSIGRPWSGWTNVGDSTTFGSQPAYVLPVGNSFLYMGDRWAGAWSGPVNDSRYVWLPIAFPSSTSMSLSWYPTVTIDAAAAAEVQQYTCNTGANQQWSRTA